MMTKLTAALALSLSLTGSALAADWTPTSTDEARVQAGRRTAAETVTIRAAQGAPTTTDEARALRADGRVAQAERRTQTGHSCCPTPASTDQARELATTMKPTEKSGEFQCSCAHHAAGHHG